LALDVDGYSYSGSEVGMNIRVILDVMCLPRSTRPDVRMELYFLLGGCGKSGSSSLSTVSGVGIKELRGLLLPPSYLYVF
jgi:hypothetical protein